MDTSVFALTLFAMFAFTVIVLHATGPQSKATIKMFFDFLRYVIRQISWWYKNN